MKDQARLLWDSKYLKVITTRGSEYFIHFDRCRRVHEETGDRKGRSVKWRVYQ